jgi:hypothetical protein
MSRVNPRCTGLHCRGCGHGGSGGAAVLAAGLVLIAVAGREVARILAAVAEVAVVTVATAAGLVLAAGAGWAVWRFAASRRRDVLSYRLTGASLPRWPTASRNLAGSGQSRPKSGACLDGPRAAWTIPARPGGAPAITGTVVDGRVCALCVGAPGWCPRCGGTGTDPDPAAPVAAEVYR